MKKQRSRPQFRRRYVKRRTPGKKDTGPGEYTSWLHLHLMCWLMTKVPDLLVIPEIARGLRMTPKALRKVLTRLKRRGLVRSCEPSVRHQRKGKKRIQNHNCWVLTQMGIEHFVSTMAFKTYTSRVTSCYKSGRFDILLDDLEKIRFVLIPAIQRLKGLHHDVYHIERLIQTRPVYYLLKLLKWSRRAINPAAHFVSSCIGPMQDAERRRVRAALENSRFFKRAENREWLDEFIYTVQQAKFFDLWKGAMKSLRCLEKLCLSRRDKPDPDMIWEAVSEAMKWVYRNTAVSA